MVIQTVYIVKKCSYEDDYKHRWDSGFYDDICGCYSSYEKADKKRYKVIREEIKDRLESVDINDWNGVKNYFETDDKYHTQLKKKYEHDEDTLEKIYDELFKGEYVDRTFNIEIKKYEVY